MNKQQTVQDTQKVWRAVDILRGTIAGSDYKKIVLPLLALRYLEGNPDQIELPDEAKWREIVFASPLKEKILKGFKMIEDLNPSLRGVFQSSYLNEIEEEVYQQIIPILNQVVPTEEFAGEILYSFSAVEGKFSSDFITPVSLTKLIPSLLDIEGGEIYDGAAGVCQLLIESAKFSKKNGKDIQVYGQEIQRDTWALGMINLLLHQMDLDNFALGNTITEPAFVTNGSLQKFDYVVMNFPFSLKNWGREKVEFDLYDRFPYGVPSAANGDMAFIQHALSSLKSNGKAALVVTHGSLFRGGVERKIREGLIKDDLIEAIIGLPNNLFVSTGIPVALLILNRDKSPERRGKIQFINAEDYFEKTRGQNFLRDEDIERIKHAYKENSFIKQFSTLVSIDKIEDSNLHVRAYFDLDEIETMLGTVQVNRRAYEQSNLDQTKLKKLVEMFRGLNVPSKKDMEDETGDYHLIQLADIQDGQIQLDRLTPIDIEPRKANAYEVKEGDIILSSRGAAIKVAVVPSVDKKMVLSHNFIGMRPRKGVNSYFIKAFLESPIGLSYITAKQKGTAVTVLSVKDIENIPIPNLDVNAQNEIGNSFVKADCDLTNVIQKAKEQHSETYYTLYERMGLTKALKTEG